MCAIVDANVASEVFGSSPSPAGDQFFDWINRGSRRLVASGKLLEELETSSPGFREWASQAVLAGTMRVLDESEVGAMTDQIEHKGIHTSDDPHILALAQLSGARLLYSKDVNLQHDFKNKQLIDNPRGKVYSAHNHTHLLKNKNLCKSG